jgi:hypothetical protein
VRKRLLIWIVVSTALGLLAFLRVRSVLKSPPLPASAKLVGLSRSEAELVLADGHAILEKVYLHQLFRGELKDAWFKFCDCHFSKVESLTTNEHDSVTLVLVRRGDHGACNFGTQRAARAARFCRSA